MGFCPARIGRRLLKLEESRRRHDRAVHVALRHEGARHGHAPLEHARARGARVEVRLPRDVQGLQRVPARVIGGAVDRYRSSRSLYAQKTPGSVPALFGWGLFNAEAQRRRGAELVGAIVLNRP